MTAKRKATTAVPTKPRWVPPSVSQALLEASRNADEYAPDEQIAEEIARAVIDAWEANTETEPPPPPDPVLTIERHPGGGWYWTCAVGDRFCDDGSPKPWFGWGTTQGARMAGGFHLQEVHQGRGMQ